jgi:hypothetical protein
MDLQLASYSWKSLNTDHKIQWVQSINAAYLRWNIYFKVKKSSLDLSVVTKGELVIFQANISSFLADVEDCRDRIVTSILQWRSKVVTGRVFQKFVKSFIILRTDRPDVNTSRGGGEFLPNHKAKLGR